LEQTVTVTSTTATSTSTAATSTSSRQTLAGDFDTFLKLLTTQLRQQDPLQPMDATAFTSQLVQFASVEQAIQANTKLDSLTQLTRTSGTAAALGLLGQQVSATTDQVALPTEGDASIHYRLPSAAAEVQISLLDASGRVVHTAAGDPAAGDHVLTWNGLGAGGERLPSGSYTARIEAKDAEGTTIVAEQFLSGKVQGIEPRDGDVQLLVDGIPVSLAAIRSVSPSA
jgi:flagellar basal-body rod modification protein FlgD